MFRYQLAYLVVGTLSLVVAQQQTQLLHHPYPHMQQKTASIIAKNRTTPATGAQENYSTPSESVIMETGASHVHPKKSSYSSTSASGGTGSHQRPALETSALYPISDYPSARPFDDPWAYLDTLHDLSISYESPRNFDYLKGFSPYDKGSFSLDRDGGKYPHANKPQYKELDTRLLYGEPSYAHDTPNTHLQSKLSAEQPNIRKVEYEERLPSTASRGYSPLHSRHYEQRTVPLASEFGYNLYDSRNVIPYNPHDYKKYHYGYTSKSFDHMYPSEPATLAENFGFLNTLTGAEPRPASSRISQGFAPFHEGRFSYRPNPGLSEASIRPRGSSRFLESFLPLLRAYGMGSYEFDPDFPRNMSPSFLASLI